MVSRAVERSVRWTRYKKLRGTDKGRRAGNCHASRTTPSIFTFVHEKQKWMSLPGTSSDRSNRRHRCNPMRQNCPRMMLASHSRCGHSFATCVARSASGDLQAGSSHVGHDFAPGADSIGRWSTDFDRA